MSCGIQVSYGDQTITLPLNSNKNLNLELLQVYFPNANGLTYVQNNNVYGVAIIEGELIINQTVNSYQVQSKLGRQVVHKNMDDSILNNFLTSNSDEKILGDINATDLDAQKLQKYFHICNYHKEGYRYIEIVQLLAYRHNIHVSLRQLKRIIATIGLQRRSKSETPLPEIVAVILEELNASGCCLGYKALWQRITKTYGLRVYRHTVLEILRIADPEGIIQRSRKRLRRRKYIVPGPNFLWHIDGYDKLKPFGFAIHGCIDGYSRKILWLDVASSNNNPKIIAYYYLTIIKKLRLVPKILRSDLGTENCNIELLQQSLRYHHPDSCAGSKSFIKGKSTSNQRIESY